jgi:hypothetical protein
MYPSDTVQTRGAACISLIAHSWSTMATGCFMGDQYLGSSTSILGCDRPEEASREHGRGGRDVCRGV